MACPSAAIITPQDALLTQDHGAHVIPSMSPAAAAGCVTVRVGTVADAASLSAFVRGAFRSAFGGLCSSVDLELFLARSLTPEIQASELASSQHTYFLAERASALVGCAMLSESAIPIGVAEPTSLEIHRVYGIGVGALLMEAVHKHAALLGHRGTWLGVWDGNSRAFGFYRRLGYQQLAADAPTFMLGQTPWRMVLFERGAASQAAVRQPHSPAVA